MSAKHRTAAVGLLFQLLTNNFTAERTLTNLQVSLTVQLSKMVPHIKPQGEVYLKQAVSALRIYSTRYTAWLGAGAAGNTDEAGKFSSELEILLKRLSTILAVSSCVLFFCFVVSVLCTSL
jgi:hypothetical protein